MKNFTSLLFRVGGLLAGLGMFTFATGYILPVTAIEWLNGHMSAYWLNIVDDYCVPCARIGAALIGIGLQAVAIGLVIRCTIGAARYAGRLVGLQEPVTA
jgi:hypothetical protein